jgi:hypothetical protein
MHIEAKKGTKHHTDVILADSGKKTRNYEKASTAVSNVPF